MASVTAPFEKAPPFRRPIKEKELTGKSARRAF
jgi:hypothetical protein